MFLKKGFTLIEIIVVLVILAILAATAMPSMLGFVDESKRKALTNEIKAVYIAMQTYATDRYALGDNDIQVENNINGTITQSHKLYSLIKRDATGEISSADIESGRVKSFNYVKNGVMAIFNAGTGIEFADATGSNPNSGSSSGLTDSQLAELKAQLKSELQGYISAEVIQGIGNLPETVSTLSSTVNNLSQTAATKTELSNYCLTSAILDKTYPVGSYYVSNSATSPETLFGGKWVQVENKFLYCMAGSNAKKPENSSANLSVGGTGGSATHTHTTGNFTLKIEHIPSHSHKTSSDSGYYAWGGIHQNLIAAGDGWSNSLANVNTSSVGGGQPHNHGDTGSSSNIPPYIAVYCWRRTQ